MARRGRPMVEINLSGNERKTLQRYTTPAAFETAYYRQTTPTAETGTQ
jgi:hypothetical protein